MQKELHAFFSNPRVRWALCVFGAILVLLLTLDAGISIGERHAYSHPGHMGGGPPPMGMSIGMGGGFLPHGFMQEEHGAVGAITAVSFPTVTIQTRSGETIAVRVATSTTLVNGGPATSTDSLMVGQKVIIIGEPEDGGIEARLIRVLP